MPRISSTVFATISSPSPAWFFSRAKMSRTQAPSREGPSRGFRVRTSMFLPSGVRKARSTLFRGPTGLPRPSLAKGAAAPLAV
jgi:hypothetical protein